MVHDRRWLRFEYDPRLSLPREIIKLLKHLVELPSCNTLRRVRLLPLGVDLTLWGVLRILLLLLIVDHALIP